MWFDYVGENWMGGKKISQRQKERLASLGINLFTSNFWNRKRNAVRMCKHMSVLLLGGELVSAAGGASGTWALHLKLYIYSTFLALPLKRKYSWFTFRRQILDLKMYSNWSEWKVYWKPAQAILTFLKVRTCILVQVWLHICTKSGSFAPGRPLTKY